MNDEGVQKNSGLEGARGRCLMHGLDYWVL